MKKKLLISLAAACLLCACGNTEENLSEKETTTTTTAPATTTTATTTTVATTTTINTNPDSNEVADIDDRVFYDDYDKMIERMTEEHGDNYYIPDFDETKYTFTEGVYHEIFGNFKLYFEDENGNTVGFSSMCSDTREYESFDEFYESGTSNMILPITTVPREDLNGYFCEWDVDTDEYYFVGYNSEGYKYVFDYYGENCNEAIEEVEQALKAFNVV